MLSFNLFNSSHIKMEEAKKNYNVNNPSIKRIMREMKEMENEKTSEFVATPLEVTFRE